jgi:hypothetical protein
MTPRELTPIEQRNELHDEFMEESAALDHPENDRPTIIRYINALLDEYTDRVLPQLLLIDETQ